MTVNRTLIASAGGKKLRNEVERWLGGNQHPSDFEYVLGTLQRRTERSHRAVEASWFGLAVAATLFAVWLAEKDLPQLLISGGGALFFTFCTLILTLRVMALDAVFDAVFDRSTKLHPAAPTDAAVTTVQVGRWRIIIRKG